VNNIIAGEGIKLRVDSKTINPRLRFISHYGLKYLTPGDIPEENLLDHFLGSPGPKIGSPSHDGITVPDNSSTFVTWEPEIIAISYIACSFVIIRDVSDDRMQGTGSLCTFQGSRALKNIISMWRTLHPDVVI